MFQSNNFLFIDLDQCPPGTMARTRLRTNQKYQNSLMPFCRKCPPAQYQSDFNQNKCLQCPSGQTSPRGAISIENCFDEKRDICKINTGICGPHGICVQENGNHHLYSCLCEDGFTGGFYFLILSNLEIFLTKEFLFVNCRFSL